MAALRWEASLTWASNVWCMKNSDFRPISRFFSEMIKDRAIVTMETNRKPYPSFRMVPFSMILSNLERLSEIFDDMKHRAVSLR